MMQILQIFIDRDPDLFRRILNYLRTNKIDLQNVDLSTLKHEAQYYGVGPLVKRLTVSALPLLPTNNVHA